jgi:hypothetical protein
MLSACPHPVQHNAENAGIICASSGIQTQSHHVQSSERPLSAAVENIVGKLSLSSVITSLLRLLLH